MRKSSTAFVLDKTDHREGPDFWTKYHALRRAKMPVESDIYSVLENAYAEHRQGFHRQWKNSFSKTIPASAVRFYNNAFSQAHDSVRDFFVRSSAPAAALRLVDDAYGIRVSKKTTLRELLDLDVFGEKTVNQDIHPDYVFEGIESFARKAPGVLSDTHHFFLHRPQQTEHIFLHEIVVGFLLNEIEYGGRIFTRAEFPFYSPVYSPYAAYTLSRLARLLNRSECEVATLHLQSSEAVTKSLPPFVRELMLASSHIYWYMDYFSKYTGTNSPSELLRIIYSFFIVPSIERQMVEKNLKLRPAAGKFVDAKFCDEVLVSPVAERDGFNDTDLVQTLYFFVDHLWRASARKSKK